jgi:hypothetical protein
MMLRSATLWPFVNAGLAVAVLGVVVGGLDSPLRLALVLPFLLLAPGMAVVRLLRIYEPAAVLMLAVALSLTLEGAVAGTMVYAQTWSPVGGLVGLTAFTLAANAADVVLSLRRQAHT